MKRPDGPGSIAIIGMAGRFPGARTIDAFWENLRDGVESIRRFSVPELVAAGVSSATAERADYVPAKGVLDDVEWFDAPFFGFSPSEAALTDPQHRIFLECCWEALERAGYGSLERDRTTGVYAGAGVNTYLLFNLMAAGLSGNPGEALQLSIHNKADHLTTRVAYKLNLRGPAITVQTACSSSLVAVCLACQSLLTYQTDMALAGGVTINVPQIGGYLFQVGGTGSRDGHCRAFDARASGTVDGSGAGVVVLKRLEDALADRDHVLAVIRGAAMNNDGGQKQGYTAPAVNGQAEVIAMAHAMADVHPDDVSYIEAHGTGTHLGDPIEVAALSQVFSASSRRTPPCALGSVKTNIGHLDAAAGIAGLIKTVLALGHRLIPPSLHFEVPNPAIDFERSPFRVSTRATEWVNGPGPRRAGVSSFGIGGTNAHVVLEEAPAEEKSVTTSEWEVLPLSAATESALETMTEALAGHLARHPDLAIADVAHTLQAGRTVFSHRRVVVCGSAADAAHSLQTLTPARVLSRYQDRIHRPVVFAFPGAGSQYLDMAAGLYREQLTFRREVDRCAELADPHLPVPLLDVMFPAGPSLAGSIERLDRPEFTLPALFAIEYSLARWWMTLGLEPHALLGHGIGEYVAACLSGVFHLEDAVAVVLYCGRAIQGLPEGRMLSVGLAESQLIPFLGDRMTVAAVHSATQCVISGPRADAEQCEAALVAKGIAVRRLPGSHAFQSKMMAPAADALATFLQNIPLVAPRIPFVSGVTGTWATEEDVTRPGYWATQLQKTLRFADGLTEALKIADALLIEAGPGKTLRTLTRWHPAKTSSQVALTSLPPRDVHDDAYAHILKSVGEAWLAGAEVAWGNLRGQSRPRRLPLPTYPFERQRYWIEPGVVGFPATGTERHAAIDDWFYLPVWKRAPLPEADHSSDLSGTTWMVLADRGGFGARLAASLRSRGAVVVTVVEGNDFGRSEADAYPVRSTTAEDYVALSEALQARGALPDFVLHCWLVDDLGSRARIRAIDLGFHSVAAFMQVMGVKSANLRALVVVSTGLQHVAEGDPVCAEKAAVLGAVRVIPQEYDRTRCLSIDLSLSDLGDTEERAIIAAALDDGASVGADAVSAWRHGERWLQEFTPTTLTPALDRPSLMKHRGVFVITGGFGGVGQRIAHHLTRTRQARLVLLGRTKLPPPERWNEILTADGADLTTVARIRAVRRLEAAGAEVLALSADVSNAEEMTEVFAQVDEVFGQIDGVVHAAGVAGGGLLQWRRREDTARVLLPKIAGTRVLEELVAARRPAVLVLASSLAGIVGRPGQADYCAANSFLDAFSAEFSARTGINTVSINWPEWRETGMAETTSLLVSQSDTEHPLLGHRTVAPSGVEVYTTRFRVDTHWVLDEHRLVGTAVVPGTAFIEMVRAALAERARGRAIEIRDLFFLAPLRVRNDQTREVQLVLSRAGDGFDFSVESDVTGSDVLSPGAARFASGSVRLIDDPPPSAIDISVVIDRCARREVPHDEDREEDLGPRWQNVVVSHVGADEVLVRLGLSPEFASDVTSYLYHPALMDRATGRAQEHLAAGSFLPIAYRRLRIYRPVPATVFSHARLRREVDPSEETLTFDTRILNAAGETLVEVEGFMQRRINDPGAAIKAFASVQAAPAPPRPAQSRLPGISAEEGVETFERILAAGTGPQVAVAPHDLTGDRVRRGREAGAQALESAGRILRQAVARHPRPALDTEYAAARTDVERRLAEAWEDALGLERAGVNDNFFELGGDSVDAIQIISRLAQQGVRLSPQQFFQHQTIAAIALATGHEQAAAEPTTSSGAGRPYALAGLDDATLSQLSQLIDEADAAVEDDDPPLESPPRITR